MASGIGEWLHDGGICSCPAGHRCHRGSDPAYSGAKSAVIFQPNLLQRGVTVMEKRTVVIHFLLVLTLLATFGVCMSALAQESAGEYVDDSVITTKVKSLLAADDFLKSFQIGVETRKGIVQLSGFVDSQQAIDKAGQIARGVGGVNSVKNSLILK